jgi:DnaJ-class molecular chaperone
MDDLIRAKTEAERYERLPDCEDCDGTGARDGDIYAPDREACWTCGGTGQKRAK